jgi:hypothetical protein
LLMLIGVLILPTFQGENENNDNQKFSNFHFLS